MADPFKHKLRDGSAYRAERIESEIERLQRRIKWAVQRGDHHAVDRLSRRLEAVESELDADLTPGKAIGRFDRYRVL